MKPRIVPDLVLLKFQVRTMTVDEALDFTNNGKYDWKISEITEMNHWIFDNCRDE